MTAPERIYVIPSLAVKCAERYHAIQAEYTRSDLIPDMLAEAEERGRKAEREAISKWCAEEADRCDDAAKWGGARVYIANCKSAAYALRNVCNVIRKGIA